MPIVETRWRVVLAYGKWFIEAKAPGLIGLLWGWVDVAGPFDSHEAAQR